MFESFREISGAPIEFAQSKRRARVKWSFGLKDILIGFARCCRFSSSSQAIGHAIMNLAQRGTVWKPFNEFLIFGESKIVKFAGQKSVGQVELSLFELIGRN